MANPIEVLVPDIGGFKDVSVIDVLVKDGQQVEKETLDLRKSEYSVPLMLNQKKLAFEKHRMDREKAAERLAKLPPSPKA